MIFIYSVALAMFHASIWQFFEVSPFYNTFTFGVALLLIVLSVAMADFINRVHDYTKRNQNA
jgi:hypothetical protein